MNNRARASRRRRAQLQVAVLASWLPVLGLTWIVGSATGVTAVSSTIAAIWTGIFLVVVINVLETA